MTAPRPRSPTIAGRLDGAGSRQGKLPRFAFEILFADNMISADRALELGLVNERHARLSLGATAASARTSVMPVRPMTWAAAGAPQRPAMAPAAMLPKL